MALSKGNHCSSSNEYIMFMYAVNHDVKCSFCGWHSKCPEVNRQGQTEGIAGKSRDSGEIGNNLIVATLIYIMVCASHLA